jgi:hypothetical protein
MTSIPPEKACKCHSDDVLITDGTGMTGGKQIPTYSLSPENLKDFINVPADKKPVVLYLTWNTIRIKLLG